MTKKKKYILLSIVAACLLLVGGLGTWLYHTYLRGAAPALLPSQGDITQSLPSVTSDPNIPQNQTNLPLSLAPEFHIAVFAKGLGDPRDLLRDPQGRLLVSVPGKGQVLSFSTEAANLGAKQVLVEKLNKPHGLALHCTNTDCTLFIAEMNAVTAYPYTVSTGTLGTGTRIAELPTGGNHTSRSLHLLQSTPPQLLVAIGSSCNVCEESDSRRGSILSMSLDGSNQQPYATGLRNAVFFANQPNSNAIWVTEMGRDLLGDNTPPDEVNILQQGGKYGWPICYGNKVHDTAFDKKQYIRDPCADTITPTIALPAHVAPLGLAFIPKTSPWPASLQGHLLVAFHGSWNRSTPTGYKIVRYPLSGNTPSGEPVPVVDGFLPVGSKSALRRPVDLEVYPEGVVYVSDDKAGVIYQLTLT
ncbi:MAG: PQQ-dependent sugar dehydrogenase, partial [Candidatus Doudnabacteria bacterium]|nr:PQQ-dependent sugar dehydrogenase [Candidatus Doudnabacteria bacterium]